MRDEKDGQAPTKERYRTLIYEQLSGVTDVLITERGDGSIHWHLSGKPLARLKKPEN